MTVSDNEEIANQDEFGLSERGRLISSESVAKVLSEKHSKATVTSTVLNITNNLIGAGVLSLPKCFKDSSILGGLTLFLFVTLLSSLSMILLAICCEKTNSATFQELCTKLFSKKFNNFLQACMFIYTSFSCVSFLILLGDFFGGASGIIQSVEDEFHLQNDNTNLFNVLVYTHDNRFFIVGSITCFILLPLTFMKDLNSLKFTSVISAAGTFYLLFFLGRSYMLTEKVLEYDVFSFSWNFFTAAPIVNISFICHYNCPKYYNELSPKIRNIKTFSRAVVYSYTLTCIAYVLIALFGYLSFGEMTDGDILKNFPDDDKYAIFARLSLALVVLFTYPFAFNALRLAFISLLMNAGVSVDDRRFKLITVCLVVYTFIPGASFSNIAVVLDYKGALLGGSIGFGFVAMFFLQILNSGMVVVNEKYWQRWSYVFILWTIITSLLGVAVTTANIFRA